MGVIERVQANLIPSLGVVVLPDIKLGFNGLL